MGWICRFPWWPIRLDWFFGAFVPAFLYIFFIAGVIFSIFMLVDCLKRPASKFAYPLTKNGEYDKLIWGAAIFLSLWFYFVGAIVYFFVVKNAKPQSGE